eukprot:GHUV01029773.1.p1 GENE.GHUV01029773.1~~GHUV01029773.1.p1  ORF type:complete len:281 (+),score=62.85 GHUV01029773.1:313-1155(+)
MLYRRAAGDCSWSEALGRTYSVLNNCPGSSVESERSFAADVVLHLVYLAGLFTFAVVLGIITDDIGTHVDKVRRGNHPVIEQNHTVVLNWNQQTLPVLQQIAKARHESGGTMFNVPIVVLADKDKDEMDDQVVEELEGTNLRVMTRSGNPAKPSEQKRASVATADTVVLMWPSDLSPADASAQQAAVLAALKTAGGVAGQKIVVQSAGQEVGEYDAVQVGLEAGVDQLVSSEAFGCTLLVLLEQGWGLSTHWIMSRLVSQSWLAAMYNLAVSCRLCSHYV